VRRRRASRVTPARAACALQRAGPANIRSPRRFAARARAVGILALGIVAACARGEDTSGAASRTKAVEELPPAGSAPPFLPPLAHAPLDTPLVVTDDFGERRGNHFHAALDFSTGERVGKSVYAPGSGWVERVRTSGGGYGRSIYLHADDGRLFVFGHLDAFDEPLASYADSVQRAIVEYEQDLAPPPGRFRVSAGQRIAWSGESGVGPPHLHLEIRIGDMAMNPLRAGLALPDTRVPEIRRIVLEPADDHSWVERRPAPWEWTRSRSDTVTVEGRVRVRVDAEDGFTARRDGMTTYATSIEFDKTRVECRFDSVSWATDMGEVDQVYDGASIRLWAPAFRPRVLHAIGGNGTLEVQAGDAPRPFRVAARDAAGNTASRVLWLRPPRAGATGPDTTGVGPLKRARFDVRAEPAAFNCLRLEVRGAPPGSRGVTIELAPVAPAVPATRVREAWVAILKVARAADASLVVRGRSRLGPWSIQRPLRVVPGTQAGPGQIEAGPWRVSAGAWFEPGVLTVEREAPRPAPELRPTSDVLVLGPPSAPLRTPWTVVVELAPRRVLRRIGLYHSSGKDWSWTRAAVDTTRRTWSVETRKLGRFALLEDVSAPRVRLLRVRRHAARDARPYSRWALEARVVERGSGVDPALSVFVVDGVAVPSEWDLDAQVLRWRPRTPPARGAHRFTVIVFDHAGNRAQASGRFVLN